MSVKYVVWETSKLNPGFGAFWIKIDIFHGEDQKELAVALRDLKRRQNPHNRYKVTETVERELA